MKDAYGAERSVAVVLGGSATGLMAAAALARAFRKVVVVERDSLEPDGPPAPRKGVAQGNHNHNITPRATLTLARLFPAIERELADAGASVCDAGSRGRWVVAGHRLARTDLGLNQILASRPLLDARLLARLRATPNVEVRDRTDVCGLALDERRTRVSGVRLLAREDGSEATLSADLVVDASGRGSRAPRWLADLGFDTPAEESLEVNVSYTTRVFRRRDGDLRGDRYVYVSSVPPSSPRGSVAFAVDGSRWMVLLFAYGEKPPSDLPGFQRFASTLPAPELAEIVHGCDPIGDAASYGFPRSVRRRYDRCARLPADFVVVGDALQSTNPAWGLGITSAALQIEVLEAALRERERASDGFFAAAIRAGSAVWDPVMMRDMSLDCVDGTPPAPMRGVMRAFNAALGTAEHDPVVGRIVLGVIGHVRSPAAILRPDIACRILLGALSPRLRRVARPAAAGAQP